MSLAALDTAPPPPHGMLPERSNTRPPPLTAAQIARADAVIAALARLWPQCFHVFERRRRPLAIGINRVLIEHMQPAIKAGHISENDIRWALRRYVNATGYLKNLAIINNLRIGLDGRPAGAVTERQALHARWRVKRRNKTKNGTVITHGPGGEEACGERPR